MKSFVDYIRGMLLKFLILLICLNLASSQDQIKFPRKNLTGKLLSRKFININVDDGSCSSNETKQLLSCFNPFFGHYNLSMSNNIFPNYTLIDNVNRPSHYNDSVNQFNTLQACYDKLSLYCMTYKTLKNYTMIDSKNYSEAIDYISWITFFEQGKLNFTYEQESKCARHISESSFGDGGCAPQDFNCSTLEKSSQCFLDLYNTGCTQNIDASKQMCHAWVTLIWRYVPYDMKCYNQVLSACDQSPTSTPTETNTTPKGSSSTIHKFSFQTIILMLIVSVILNQ